MPSVEDEAAAKRLGRRRCAASCGRRQLRVDTLRVDTLRTPEPLRLASAQPSMAPMVWKARAVGVSMLSGSLLITPAVHCQEATTTLTPTPTDADTDATAGVKLTEESPTAAPSAAARREAALSAYTLGEVDTALEEMKKLLRECQTAGDEGCRPKVQGVLYRDIAVILAGGKGDHDSAVRSFRQALRLNPQIEVPRDLRSASVDRAYAEAKSLEKPAPPPVAAAPTAAPEAAPAASSSDPWAMDSIDTPPSPEQEAEWSSGADKQKLLLEAFGTAKLGSATAGGVSATMGQFGASLLLADVFKGGFTAGAQLRMRGNQFFEYDAGGFTWGLAGMFGATFARNAHQKTHHTILGGLGFEHAPDAGLAGIAISAQWTAALGGFAIGPALDILYYSNRGLTEADVLFGVNFGYAGLL